MNYVTYKQAFKLMCRDIDDNHITILVPTSIGDNMSFGVRVVTFEDDELIEYDKALKQFKAMFKKYFEFIFDGTIDEAANWIGEKYSKG